MWAQYVLHFLFRGQVPDGSQERYWRGFMGWFLIFILVVLAEPVRAVFGVRDSWFLLSTQVYEILCSKDSRLFSKWHKVAIYSNFLFIAIRFET